jgi:acyl carrier protein
VASQPERYILRDERAGAPVRKGETNIMEMAELEQKVCKILADNLSVPEDKVTPASRFQEDLDADSLDLVEAVLALEEEFGVTIPEEEMEGVKTVGQAIQLVATKLGVAA